MVSSYDISTKTDNSIKGTLWQVTMFGFVSLIFSTSDSMISDVLMLSKVRDLENFVSGSGVDPL